MISRDTCSATTLSANQACSVAIEFGASAAGTTTVALSFSTDKAATVYTANISVAATDSGNPGTCDGSWDPVKVYHKGDKVKWAGKVWQAQWWTQGDNPSDSGPWGVWQDVGVADCGAK